MTQMIEQSKSESLKFNSSTTTKKKKKKEFQKIQGCEGQIILHNLVKKSGYNKQRS
jgi:hypothetical protein